MEKNVYVVEFLAQTTYIIKAESEDAAVEKARQYFEEYIPDICVTVDNDEEPEIEI